MTQRTMGPGRVILLAFLTILSIDAAQGKVNTIDYLQEEGYGSRPCLISHTYSVCKSRGYCGAVNKTHFTCKCSTSQGKTSCVGTFPDPCSLLPCKNGLCVPEGGVSAHYTCQCRPGYFGNLCQYGPLTKCAYQVVGVVPSFTTFFPTPYRTPKDFTDLRDMCISKGLVLIKNPIDHCLLQYYSMVSGAIGNHKGFVYLGFDGPLYVSIHARYPISYKYKSGFSKLIAAHKKIGFSIIQICMEPPNINGLLILPQIVMYGKRNIACDLLGLAGYTASIYTTGGTNPGVRAALKFMANTYYGSQSIYYGLPQSANRVRQQLFMFTPGFQERVVAYIPKGTRNTVSICQVGNPCALKPCGPNTFSCLTQIWGFKCLCKNGYTGEVCTVDMAAHRETCGTYTLYTLANAAVFKNEVRSIGVVHSTCTSQSASLPPKPMSQCELDFYRTVSKRFFNSHSYMYYTARDQEMAFASYARHISYAFTDRFNFHPQAVICHGSVTVEKRNGYWQGERGFKAYDPCQHSLIAGCKSNSLSG